MAEERPHFSARGLYELQSSIGESFIAPNNAIQAMKVNSSLLAESVRVRIDVTREFIGVGLNTEYLSGFLHDCRALSLSAFSEFRYGMKSFVSRKTRILRAQQL